jgi:hypothetical protein
MLYTFIQHFIKDSKWEHKEAYKYILGTQTYYDGMLIFECKAKDIFDAYTQYQEATGKDATRQSDVGVTCEKWCK